MPLQPQQQTAAAWQLLAASAANSCPLHIQRGRSPCPLYQRMSSWKLNEQEAGGVHLVAAACTTIDIVVLHSDYSVRRLELAPNLRRLGAPERWDVFAEAGLRSHAPAHVRAHAGRGKRVAGEPDGLERLVTSRYLSSSIPEAHAAGPALRKYLYLFQPADTCADNAVSSDAMTAKTILAFCAFVLFTGGVPRFFFSGKDFRAARELRIFSVRAPGAPNARHHVTDICLLWAGTFSRSKSGRA
jgi:hypothetical protein